MNSSDGQLMMQEYDMPGSFLFELVQVCTSVQADGSQTIVYFVE